jgi:hypothetical protein
MNPKNGLFMANHNGRLQDKRKDRYGPVDNLLASLDSLQNIPTRARNG